MKFEVPQFLERESKIAGPFTFKHLTFLGGGGIILFFLYFFVPKGWFYVFAFFIGSLVLALIFVKIDGVPLPTVILRSFGYFLQPKTFIWKRTKLFTPVKLSSKMPAAQKDRHQEETTLTAAPKGKIGKLQSRVDLGT